MSRASRLSPPHQGDARGPAQGRRASRLSPPHQGDARGPAQGRRASRLSAVLPLLLLLAPVVRAQPALSADAGTERLVQPLAVGRQVIPDEVRLGEPFVYRITLHHPSGQRWELRTPRDLGGFELIEQSRTRTDGKNESTTTYLLKMAMFVLGSHVLPTLTFDVVDAEGASVARIDGPDIQAKSSLPKDAEQLGVKLEDIKPNEDVPVRSWRLLWWLAGLAALATLAVLARRAWLRRPRRLPPPPPLLPLEDRIRQALDALDAEGLPQRGMQREFHFRLSGVVRGYLGERFGFDALECTSGELLAEAERRGLPGVDQDALRRFVDQCDVARYARGEVPVPACAAALGFGRTLLEATRPRPEPVEPAAPPAPPSPTTEVAG
jgi:hypothetical protein